MERDPKKWRVRLPKASLDRHRTSVRAQSGLDAPSRIELHTGKRAATFLISGLNDFAVRSFMAAKTVGDIDHGAKKVHHATGKKSCVRKETVHERLGSTQVAESRSRPKASGAAGPL